MGNTENFTLREIADWQLGKPNSDKTFVQIPSLQRGLVWNATQAEVLWDSLMRGIPVGTFSLISAKAISNQKKSDCNLPENWDYQNTFWLLDGQQRANTIAMGYRQFANKNSDEEDKNMPILWLDLLPTEKRSNRRFFFRVTTSAHPWGYKISDSGKENKNTPLAAWEQKEACSDPILGDRFHALKSIKKPKSFELWPAQATLPIPFYILLKNEISVDNITSEKIHELVENDFLLKDSNWWKKFKNNAGFGQVEWTQIINGLKKISQTSIFAQVAPDDLTDENSNSGENDNTEIATYFLRMNKSGVEPSMEDINYSILKSIAPELSHVDELAKGRMGSSWLARLAMLIFISFQDNKWHGSISRPKVYSLAKNDKFVAFIQNDLKTILEKVDQWLISEGELLPIHKTYLAHGHPQVYQLLLLMAKRNITADCKYYAGIATLLAWFGNDAVPKIFEAIAKLDETANDKSTLLAIKNGIYQAITNNKLSIPPTPDYFDQIKKIISSDQQAEYRAQDVFKLLTQSQYVDVVEIIRPWTTSSGRELLLFSCREFMNEVFGKFDSAQCAYSEENRPWDYDHIFPRSWLISGQGRSQGKWHRLIEKYINSIGNIAPLPFQLNRGKNDNPPGKYCGGDNNNQLMVTVTSLFDENNSCQFENNIDKGLDFIRITAQRMHQLYNRWYNDLNIAELLDFSEINHPRKTLFNEIKKAYPESKIYYVSGALQYECSCSADWARPWLAIGIVRDTPQKDFVCIAANEKRIELGIRRHPEENSINKDSNRWWYVCDDRKYNFQSPPKGIAIIEELKKLCEQEIKLDAESK